MHLFLIVLKADRFKKTMLEYLVPTKVLLVAAFFLYPHMAGRERCGVSSSSNKETNANKGDSFETPLNDVPKATTKNTIQLDVGNLAPEIERYEGTVSL